MTRLLGLGLLAALFFSSTFVLNRAMSLAGGHWLWSASLRYLWMLTLLGVGLLVSGRGRILADVAALFRQHWRLWLVAGSVGFGVFYAGISFAASYAPSWVVATTWQFTILASPIVLALFGRRVPMRGLAFTLLIFVGIVLVNYEQMQRVAPMQALLGALPVLLSAFAYPAGLQLLWEARQGSHGRVPHITHPALDNTFARILLLTLGSAPFWLLLLVIVRPPPPTPGQWFNTALVAILSGVVATGLFIYARQRAANAYEIAAVDATQSGEVIFSLMGEVAVLGGVLPGAVGLTGVAVTVVGLVLYLLAQQRSSASVQTES